MNGKPRMRHIMNVVERVAAEHGVHGIFTRSRSTELVRWRQQVMVLGREARFSTLRIGSALGVDHSTVVHGACAMRKLIEEGNEYAITVDRTTRAALARHRDGFFDPERVSRRVNDLLPPKAVERLDETTEPVIASELTTELRKLRRQKWSVYGLAKRFDITPHEVEALIGEKVFHGEVRA